MLYFLMCLLVVFADQLTKYYVSLNFYEGESVVVVENIFHWTYVLNSGAAFGILSGGRWILILIALSVGLAVWFLREEIAAGGRYSKIGSALFLGGALGNLIDRVRTGLVVDFFDFRVWPVFNVADIAICVGVGCLVWSLLKAELENRESGC